jgi:hypothetical protein
MVSESICLAILEFVRGLSLTLTTTFGDAEPQKSVHQDAATDSDIYRHLLSRYDLVDIDAAMRWLELGHYIGQSSATIRGPFWRELTDKGRDAADRSSVPEDEKKLLYQEQDPYAVFVAHQFNRDDSDLVAYLRDKVLVLNGLKLLDGRAGGLEEFRAAILAKIRQSRFFLCLLTKRTPLASGSFASSVWLYQETGVAVAYGKKPLLLVEEGIDSEYVGELQRIYEYITFTRSNHPEKFDAISRRFLIDLEANGIPSPIRNTP